MADILTLLILQFLALYGAVSFFRDLRSHFKNRKRLKGNGGSRS